MNDILIISDQRESYKNDNTKLNNLYNKYYSHYKKLFNFKKEYKKVQIGIYHKTLISDLQLSREYNIIIIIIIIIRRRRRRRRNQTNVTNSMAYKTRRALQ